MALDTKAPKGYTKEFDGGRRPVLGLDLIEQEQVRQVGRYSPEHDDAHDMGELVTAAMCYAVYASHQDRGDMTGIPETIASRWPWPDGWKPSDDPIRNLQKAGALIASEIDRLLRKQAQERSHQS